MAELRVDIASEFTGKAAFTKAQKATSSLDKAVGKLGKQIASVFAFTKIVAYGKASVKAFVEEERAVSQLTTAVKNLGLAFAQPEINNFIDRLQTSSAIVDDELRPAFQALLTTTGSLTKSQELLSLAIEGSRGSGIALTTVTQDLANAYNGNTRGLRKYNLGLTKAQLTTISFSDVQERFARQFSGANAAFLDTYAGKLDVLKVASETAKEVIGKGLVDALVLAGGKDGDIQNVSDAMGSLAEYTADTVRGMGVLIAKITQLNDKVAGGALGKIISGGFNLGFTGLLNRLGNQAQERPTAGRRFMGGQQANLYSSSASAEKKFQAQQKKFAADQLKATKALSTEQKKQAALKKAGTIFDQEQIQIIAALQGNLSKQDELRLKAQLALLNNNELVATALTKQILMSQDATGNLYKLWATLPDARNPFAYLEGYLDMLAGKAAAVLATQIPIMPPVTGSQGSQFGPGPYLPTPATNVSNTPFPRTQPGDFRRAEEASNRTGPIQVTVQIDGKAIASSLQNSSLSGIGSTVNRIER